MATPIANNSNRRASATPLPLAGNNFTKASFSFVLTTKPHGVKKVEELTLVVNPEEFRQSESSTSNVVLTAGDVFSDTFGPGLSRIRISGTFGQRPAGGSGSGQYEVMKLRQFFRKYLDAVNPITTKDPKANYSAKLQFFNPKDNEFWDIEIPGEYLVVSRSKSSPFLYRYSLSFVGMSPTAHAGMYDALRALTSGVQWVEDNIINYQGALSVFTTYSKQFLNAAVTLGYGAAFFPNQIVAPFTDMVNALTDFRNGAAGLVNFPFYKTSQLKKDILKMRTLYANSKSVADLNRRKNIDVSFNYDPNINEYLCKAYYYTCALENYETIFNKTYTKSDFNNQTSTVNKANVAVDLSKVTNVTYG